MIPHAPAQYIAWLLWCLTHLMMLSLLVIASRFITPTISSFLWFSLWFFSSCFFLAYGRFTDHWFSSLSSSSIDLSDDDLQDGQLDVGTE